MWGKFNIPLKKPVYIVEVSDRNRIHYPRREDGTAIGWNTEECKEARQQTPKGFSKAFFFSNS